MCTHTHTRCPNIRMSYAYRQLGWQLGMICSSKAVTQNSKRAPATSVHASCNFSSDLQLVQPEDGRSFFLLVTCWVPCGKAFSLCFFYDVLIASHCQDLTGCSGELLDWFQRYLEDYKGRRFLWSVATLMTVSQVLHALCSPDMLLNWIFSSLSLQMEQLVWGFTVLPVAAIKRPWCPCTGRGHDHSNHSKVISPMD